MFGWLFGFAVADELLDEEENEDELYDDEPESED